MIPEDDNPANIIQVCSDSSRMEVYEVGPGYKQLIISGEPQIIRRQIDMIYGIYPNEDGYYPLF